MAICPQEPEKPSFWATSKTDTVTTKSTAAKPKKEKGHSAEVIDGKVWIGACTAAEDTEWLESTGITHIVDLVSDDEEDRVSMSSRSEQIDVLGISRLRAPFRDTEDDSARLFMSTVIPAVIPFIMSAMSSSGKVLIHCSAGRSRAPAVAMAFLMVYRSMSFKGAMRAVSKNRSVRPNPTLMKLLYDLSDRVGPSVNSQSGSSSSSILRSRGDSSSQRR